MSEEQTTNIFINQDALIITLTAGFLLNAFYSALLLKKQSGVEITHEIEQSTLAEVFQRSAEIQSCVEKAPLKKAP